MSFYEATVKWDTETTKRFNKENHRPIYLMNMHEKKYSMKYLQIESQERHRKDHPSWSNVVQPRDEKIVQHMKICQYKPPYKQTERKRDHMTISLNAGKAFDKI